MKTVKGIILAGGNGSRLFPITYGISKQLIPIYDKPMIYYPLSTLLYCGIRDIMIISSPKDISGFRSLFGKGDLLGINISYKEQNEPKGIAESFIIAEEFIGNSDVCLILGDNIFFGDNLKDYLSLGIINLKKDYSTIFGVYVNNPNQFGVIEFDDNMNITEIIEKPKKTISNTIVSGLYFYKNSVISIAKKLKPSKRNELEITDINNIFLKKKQLKLVKLDQNISWIDTGTYDSMLYASNFFQNLEKNTSNKYACVEGIVYELGYINKNMLGGLIKSMSKSSYGKYLKRKYLKK